MDRRQIIRILGGMAAFVAATAWPRGSAGAAKIPRVGIIDDGSDWGAFRQELHELNYVEGQNIAFEYRQVDGTPDRLAAAARELAQIPVDVIAVYGTPAGQAAQQATKSIPIVAIAVGDLGAAGLVANFAHPGGNITATPLWVRISSPNGCRSCATPFPQSRAWPIFGIQIMHQAPRY